MRTPTPPPYVAVCLVLLLAAAPAAAQITHVIHVSLDGLRPDAPVLLGPTAAPNFDRLRTEGAGTDNARSDFDYTITLPNHATMITGLGVAGPSGHGWTTNDIPGPQETLHSNKGTYLPSVFDVVHDHGLSTALYSSAAKFIVFDRSYDAVNGAVDTTGADDGRDKIDVYFDHADPAMTVAQWLADMPVQLFSYSFIHIKSADFAGHLNAFDPTVGTPYSDAVVEIDGFLGQIMTLLETDPNLVGRCVLIVTADHGGTGNNHANPTVFEHYRIPFFVWGPGVAANTNLYLTNPAARQDPGTSRPDYAAAVQPIRHADGANLALALLGLPPIPGSTINPASDLSIFGPPNQGPTASLAASPATGTVPLTVTFDATGSSDPDGSIFCYHWFFSDGYTDTSPIVVRTYTDPGDHDAFLVVMDDRGAIDIAAFRVSAPYNATTVTPTADATIAFGSPAATQGADPRLSVLRGAGAGDEVRCMLDFDLGFLPPNATIVRATLELEAMQVSGPIDLVAYPLDRSWDEGIGTMAAPAAQGVTWLNTRLGLPGDQPWTTPGGDFIDADTATAAVTAPGLVSLDVTAMVDAWQTGTRPNHGLLLRAPTGAGGVFVDLASREIAPLAPRLTVEYDARVVNLPPTLQIAPGSGPVGPADALVVTIHDDDGYMDVTDVRMRIFVLGVWFPLLRAETAQFFDFEVDAAGDFVITLDALGQVINHPAVGDADIEVTIHDSAGHRVQTVVSYGSGCCGGTCCTP